MLGLTMAAAPGAVPTLLTGGDSEAMACLERVVWPARMQASEETIRERLARGHEMLALPSPDGLAGAVCYVPTAQTPRNRGHLPANYGELVGLSSSAPVRSLFIYNLAVRPDQRGSQVVWTLLVALLARCRALGGRWLVGNSRCTSYAGGTMPGGQPVPPDPVFRAAIDRWAASGQRPAEHLLLRDPLLRFYGKILGCSFQRLVPGFAPGDAPSGGFHVICVKDLSELRGLLT